MLSTSAPTNRSTPHLPDPPSQWVALVKPSCQPQHHEQAGDGRSTTTTTAWCGASDCP